MTQEQQAIIDELFSGYGVREGRKDSTLYLHFWDPSTIDTTQDIIYRDKYAAQDIATIEKYLIQLKAYRVALAERYNYLDTVPTVPVVELKREKNYYSNHVFYYLNVYKRNLDTGKDILETSAKYTGKERKQAIDDFKKYVKDHPGIINKMDIEKGRLER